MSDAAELLEEVLQLPESQRRAIALRLLDTVGDEPIDIIERRWLEEIRRRREEIAADPSRQIPWEEARARIFSRD